MNASHHLQWVVRNGAGSEDGSIPTTGFLDEVASVSYPPSAAWRNAFHPISERGFYDTGHGLSIGRSRILREVWTPVEIVEGR